MSAPFDWTEWARDVAARTSSERSPGAEAARANAAWVIEQEERERRLRDPERKALHQFWKALMLAPDVETFEALMSGESVPLDRLDPEWVGRFGRRHR